PAPLVPNRLRGQFPGEQVQVEAQVLNQAAAEFDVVIAEPLGHGGPVPAGQVEHLAIAVHADHSPLGTDDLGGNETHLAASRAEIEDDFARPDVRRRVTAAV